jgi:hypothetical protein
MNSNNFSLKICYFEIISTVLERRLDTNTIQLSRVCLSHLEVSLKAVFLQNGNKFPSIPPAHVTNMEESYENMTLRWNTEETGFYTCKECHKTESL